MPILSPFWERVCNSGGWSAWPAWLRFKAARPGFLAMISVIIWNGFLDLASMILKFPTWRWDYTIGFWPSITCKSEHGSFPRVFPRPIRIDGDAERSCDSRRFRKG